MKLDRYRMGEEHPVLPLTAMIDVLFLMIIFLVLGANFDSLTTVELPEARGTTFNKSVARVVIHPNGRAEIHPDGRAGNRPDGTAEILPGGTMRTQGKRYNPQEALVILSGSKSKQLVLLPDRRLPVGELFRWYDTLSRGLKIPVRVGVSPPKNP